MPRTIHIIGAGLAGLAAAVELTGRGETVVVHEATELAGGRCRSYHDASLGMTIDNGNHLLLSGNHAALGYLRTIGAEHRLVGPPQRGISLRRSRDAASAGRCASTTAACRGGSSIQSRRVPGTRALDYLPLARLLWAARDKAVGEVIRFTGTVYERLVRPLLLAALNIDPRRARRGSPAR